MKALARLYASARHARAAVGGYRSNPERLGMTIILLSCLLTGTVIGALIYRAIKWAGWFA